MASITNHSDVGTVELDADALRERMNCIRNRSEHHVAGMHEEAGRVFDWREHVKSQPLVAAGVAAAAGYSMVSSFLNRSEKTVSRKSTAEASTAEASTVQVATKATLASSLVALAGAAATTAAKQWATSYLKKQLKGARYG